MLSNVFSALHTNGSPFVLGQNENPITLHTKLSHWVPCFLFQPLSASMVIHCPPPYSPTAGTLCCSSWYTTSQHLPYNQLANAYLLWDAPWRVPQSVPRGETYIPSGSKVKAPFGVGNWTPMEQYWQLCFTLQVSAQGQSFWESLLHPPPTCSQAFPHPGEGCLLPFPPRPGLLLTALKVCNYLFNVALPHYAESPIKSDSQLSCLLYSQSLPQSLGRVGAQ